VQIYFAILLYSYASHLRKGSYRSLPLSRPNPLSSLPSATFDTALADEDEEIEDFYRVPVKTARPGGSLSNLSDFVNGPGRTRNFGGGRIGKSVLGKDNGHANVDGDVEVEEVLFDDDELSSRGHSKFGTEESISSSSQSDGDRFGGSHTHGRSRS
jgi:hypothetical protein